MAVPAETADQIILRSVMQFTRIFHHLIRATLQHHFPGGKPSEFAALHIIRRGSIPASSDQHGGDGSASPSMKLSEISKCMQVTSPAVTQLIKGLEADGLVERRPDPTDKRIVGIALTTQGKAVTQRADDAIAAAVRGLTEYLGPAQSQQLAELLGIASRYLQEREPGYWGDGLTPPDETGRGERGKGGRHGNMGREHVNGDFDA